MASKKSRLSVEEKRERDARAQRWMNNRKIERVAEAAERHGWYILPAESIVDNPLRLDEYDCYVFEYYDGTYRYERTEENGEILARRIA